MNDSDTNQKQRLQNEGPFRVGHLTPPDAEENSRQSPWRIPVNQDPPVLPEEGVEAIHDGAMKILENIGIEFLNESQELCQSRTRVEGSNVRMDREWVMEMVRKAPSIYHPPRNEREIIIETVTFF